MSDLALSDVAIEQKPSRRLWVCAAIGALALHIGCAALAFERIKDDGGDDALGANAVEVGVEFASPKVDDMDLPPGPEKDEQSASVATPQQEEEAKPTNLPQDTPTETPDPDRIVSRTKSDKPTEDDPKVETQKMMPQPDQDAQVATAPQTLDNARESDTTTAPNIGLGKDRQKLTADWGRKVSAYFEMHKRFPESAHKSANVKVALVLNRLGHVLSAAVEESSGDPLYDEAALSMIRRSDPVPRPPAKLTDDEFRFSLEVRFNGSKK